MERTPVIGGNWKMFKTVPESEDYVKQFINLLDGSQKKVEVIIIPPFTALSAVSKLLDGTNVHVGAQNMYFKVEGAFTGEISPRMLLDAGATHVVLGHSERRQVFGETDALIAQKAIAAHESGLKPIICIGETLDERNSGKMKEVLRTQLSGSLETLSASHLACTIIAYEPVWAIGTGVRATVEQAQEAHTYIRSLLGEKYGQDVASQVRIQYGGSIKHDKDPGSLFKQPDIDGGLVGGDSLNPDSFASIIKSALATP